MAPFFLVIHKATLSTFQTQKPRNGCVSSWYV